MHILLVIFLCNLFLLCFLPLNLHFLFVDDVKSLFGVDGFLKAALGVVFDGVGFVAVRERVVHRLK